MGNDDDIELFQVIGLEDSIGLELEIIGHNTDNNNTDDNPDLDIYVINTDLETISSGAGLGRVETAQIPAGPNTIFYIIIDHYRGYNEVPSSYILRQLPASSVTESMLTKMHQSNSDLNIGKIFVRKEPDSMEVPSDVKIITESLGSRPAGVVEVNPETIFSMVGVPTQEASDSSLLERFKGTYEIGKWRKAIELLKIEFPKYVFELDYKMVLHADEFVRDPLYDQYQWWNFDIVNLPEGLNVLGQELKPVNVAVLDSGSPDVQDQAGTYSIFDDNRGWDMVDEDSLAYDVEFGQGSFSHGTHVGSTISMLNDGYHGNGFGARVSPVRVCYESGCGPTYEAYLYINGDDNVSQTSWRQRTAESNGVEVEDLQEKLHSMNMSYGGGGSANSSSCEKLREISESGVLIASSSGNGGINSTSFPAACPTVFSVAATNGIHRRSSYSSTNQYVDFAAPGGEYSDWNSDGIDELVYAYGRREANVNSDTPLVGAQGTSMASPHGAGFLGLLKYYYEDVAKPFENNTSLPSVLTYDEVEKMLKANLLTNDVNKVERTYDTEVMPGRDDHLGYGIIDLQKAIKSVDAFSNGYFTNFDDLPYYTGPSLVKLDPVTKPSENFVLTPGGQAGESFNDITFSYDSSFLEVSEVGTQEYMVKIPDDYDDAGWIEETITFEFPMKEGADLPFPGYELLAVGVDVIFHNIGAAYNVDIPILKINLLDEETTVVQTTFSSISSGIGNVIISDVAPGNYVLQVCSDIDGDDAWCGPGELNSLSSPFEVTSDTGTTLGLEMEPVGGGVPNNAPTITSEPVDFADVGEDYTYRVVAVDDDGDDLSYSLVALDEDGEQDTSFISIDSTGVVNGEVKSKHVGLWNVTINVTDGIDTTSQEYVLEVFGD
ncbi:MAG: hypothetical protein CBE45_001210 [Thiotrichales bacterium TMED285]|nr:MAG: hypothetical protein CBE45_001210 [Thiotrichales bacterium TMED285]